MKNVDLYISSCERFTKLLIREVFSFEGDILETGMPRNDFLINNKSDKTRVKDYYGIPFENLLVLYAPTFRQNLKATDYNIDYNRILETLRNKYNRDVTIMYRIHHKIPKKNILCNNSTNDNIIDVSNYPDGFVKLI